MNVRNQMFCYLPKDYLYLNQWLMLKIAFFYNIWKNLNHELKAIKYSKKFKFLIIYKYLVTRNISVSCAIDYLLF